MDDPSSLAWPGRGVEYKFGQGKYQMKSGKKVAYTTILIYNPLVWIEISGGVL
jgi:hypothetical protein